MTGQTAWRKRLRRWTFRNLARMNHLLELMRLHLNRQDSPTEWAQGIKAELDHSERSASEAHPYSRRRGTKVLPRLSDPVTVTTDGSRIYTLREHPVAPRSCSRTTSPRSSGRSK